MSIHSHVSQTPHAANPHRSLRSLLCIYKMAVVPLESEGLIRWLCSSFVALVAHHRSSNWTRFKEEAHHQYKNIVQQFSCHSKHSYLSVNGPVTSAAIQIKKQQQRRNIICYTKQIEKGGRWPTHQWFANFNPFSTNCFLCITANHFVNQAYEF